MLTTATVSTVFILLVSLITRNSQNLVACVFLVFLGWQYSAPPLRLKEAPVLDSLSNGTIVFLAWFAGFSLGGNGIRDAPGKGYMLSLCTAGVHALAAIPDIEADVAAGQNTIAVAFGKRPTALFAALC